MKEKNRTPSVFGTGHVEPGERVTMTALTEETAKATSSTGFPGYSDALRGALVDGAASSVAAGAPTRIGELPITDPWALSEAERLKATSTRTQETVETLQKEVEDAERHLATLPPPCPLVAWILVVLVHLALTLAATVVVGRLMSPSVHSYLLDQYLTDTLGIDSPEYGARLAFQISAGAAGLLFMLQLVGALALRGRVPFALKTAMIAADLILAASFGVMRLEVAFSWQALAVSGFELALSVVVTISVFALSGFLSKNADKADPVKIARRARRAAAKSLKRAESVRIEAEARHASQVHALERREDAAKRAPLHEALAKHTARLGHIVGVSIEVPKAARNETDEALSTWIDRHLSERLGSGR